MNKIIELKNGNKIIIDRTPGYCCDTVSISKGYLQDNDVLKSFEFSIWDDMSFHAYSKNADEISIVEFEFDMNDPIYFCLNRLLADDIEFIIDDDDTREIMEKYMLIKKEGKIIKVIFINNKTKGYNINKFNVFIKNILSDPRSKIEDFNIKLRLIKFFRDCERVLIENYHQVTMDEYLEILNQKSLVKKI